MNKISKKICVDARLLTAPGIGTYLKNIFAHVKDTPWHWQALINEVQRDKLSQWPHIEPIVIFSKIYSLKEQFELSIKIPQVDLFWSPHYNVPCFPIRARKRLVTIHDVFHLAFSATLSLMERWYAKAMMYAATHLTDHIITVSAFSEEQIRAYTSVGRRPISVIHHGIDKAKFYPDGMDKSILEKYGLVSPFILYVGSFKAHKNLKGLIASFSQLIERENTNVQLVIVGGAAGMRHCEDVKQLCITYPQLKDKLQFVGQVPDEDLPHFYRNAELFIFPSFYEGFGLPPLEAMYCGCPTIVSNAGSLPEVCAEGACYIDPKDPAQLAFVMSELLHNAIKRHELSIKGLKRSQDFCLKGSADKHFSIIEAML